MRANESTRYILKLYFKIKKLQYFKVFKIGTITEFDIVGTSNGDNAVTASVRYMYM